MLEKVLTGGKTYWSWLTFLLLLVGIGFGCFMIQYTEGLGMTGLSRDVSWGLYIAQLTFLVGVAASAVMLVLPYYLHNVKEFGRITILGEFLAVAAIAMCGLFVFVDLGKLERVTNTFLYPTPGAILFWDIVVLNIYLILNAVIGFTVLSAERKWVVPPAWTKFLIYLSIPWAVSIHTVTAFLYAGMPGRHLWLTAIMAARFLSSAFAAGPALLIVLALVVKRFTKFDPGKEAIQKLAIIITYSAIINMFFLGLEFYTAYYSGIPGHQHSLDYLYFGIDGYNMLVPWMWASAIMAFGAILILLFKSNRQNETVLGITCVVLFLALWIDKGLGLIVGGFIPNPLHQVREYHPTAVEIFITIGVWALGFLILTFLYKIAIGVKEETGGELAPH